MHTYFKILVFNFFFAKICSSQIIFSNKSSDVIDRSFSNITFKENHINQKKSELDSMMKNKISGITSNYLAEIPSIYPLNKNINWIKISSKYSFRIHPISKKRNFHAAIDLAAPKGSLVYATANGIVEKVYYEAKTGIGYALKIKHGFKYSTLYGHLLQLPSLQHGDSVARGQVIGYVGNTGSSTGFHLHYSIFYKNTPVNPMQYCKLLENLSEKWK